MAKKPAAYPGTPVKAASTFMTDYHQNGVPVEHFKFDAAADKAAQAKFEPLMDMEGIRVQTPGVNKARIKAQMESHKNPKNRV